VVRVILPLDPEHQRQQSELLVTFELAEEMVGPEVAVVAVERVPKGVMLVLVLLAVRQVQQGHFQYRDLQVQIQPVVLLLTEAMRRIQIMAQEDREQVAEGMRAIVKGQIKKQGVMVQGGLCK
jgi:hypothetical protein